MEPLIETDFMLSSYLLKMMKYTTKVTSNLCFSPIQVDTSRGKLVINFIAWAKAVHNCLFLFSYAVIMLPTHVIEIRMASKDLKSLRSNVSIVYLYVAILFSCFFGLFMGILCFKPHAMCQFLNGLYKYIETFPGEQV
ncbi:unnamed protein product [Orchesella dallaii]|uniref:Uncharacterized protein n=1 Tax=Orchesella dallaii TaxID=48710 RepID=A0ABP1Q0Z3_9HEXA